MPVDYKGGEHSKPVIRSFVTPQVRLLLFFTMIFYFSGTGNSAWIAQQLGEALHEAVHRITDKLPNQIYTLQPRERLGFVFPVYSWGPPSVVLEWLARLLCSETPSYLYFVCTCGDDAGKTALLFRKVAERRGWVCKAGFSVTMPNTYVCLPGFDVDSVEVEKQKICDARSRIVQVIEWVDRKVSRFDCHEGGAPYTKSYLLRPLFNRFFVSASRFHVMETCISCGKCEQACPMHNIQMKEGKPEWGSQCSMCLACYHHCPKHAVAYGNQTRKKGQYIFKSPKPV